MRLSDASSCGLQAICATTPAFVVALALLMFRQLESRGVCLALVPVIAGLVLATGAEPSFDALGFTAAVAATVLRALKTVLQVRPKPAWRALAPQRCAAMRS